MVDFTGNKTRFELWLPAEDVLQQALGDDQLDGELFWRHLNGLLAKAYERSTGSKALDGSCASQSTLDQLVRMMPLASRSK